MILNNEDQALLDKVSCNGINLIEIRDYDYLYDNGYLTIKDGGEDKQIYLESGKCFTTICIEDEEYFDLFLYGVTQRETIYGRMELSVCKDDYGNINCNTAEEYRAQIENARDLLDEKYGIIVDISDIKYDFIEINKTIHIEHEYYKYQRPIALLMYNLPGKLRMGGENDWMSKSRHSKKIKECGQTTQTNKKSSGKRGIDVEFYDKKEEYNKSHDQQIEDEILRLEIKLKSSSKIKDKVGTNIVEHLTDEAINRYFSSFVRENFDEANRRFIKKRDKEIITILKNNYQPDNRTWVKNAIIEILDYEIKHKFPLVLDVEEIIPLLKTLPFKSKQARYNAKKQFRLTAKKHGSVLAGRDDLKLKEIINKLE